MTMLSLPGSDYLVKVQYYTANWGFNCEKQFDITVPGVVDPCASAGGDADGDGVCAADDCDDNNASVGARQPQEAMQMETVYVLQMIVMIIMQV